MIYHLPDSELRFEMFLGTSLQTVKITHLPTGLTFASNTTESARNGLAAKVFHSYSPVTRRAIEDPPLSPIRELRNPVTLSVVRIVPPYQGDPTGDDYVRFVAGFERYCTRLFTSVHGDPLAVDPRDVLTPALVDPVKDLGNALAALESRYGVFAVAEVVVRRNGSVVADALRREEAEHAHMLGHLGGDPPVR